MTLKNHGCTGGYGAAKKTATRVPGLAPINIETNVEFYLGVRNTQNKRYDGDRLFYDKSTTDLAPCPGETAHKVNQLWRFQRAPDHVKGVHSIVSVDAQARFTCEMDENEDGDPMVAIDFTGLRDDDIQSTSTMLYMGQLF